MDCSILLATRDRAASLDRTLASIAAQEAPGIEWEVLVADNGSTDETGAVLERWAARVPLRSVTEPTPGKNRALNRTLGMARGGLLLFTDDDVVAQPGWIAAHAAAAARWPDHQIFGGPITPRFPPDPPAWALRDPFVSVLFAAYDPGAAEGPTTELPFGPNYSLRAECIRGRGFDASVGPNGSEYPMGGETELLRRLARAGARVVYVPGAAVEHMVRAEQLTERFALERARRFGRGLVRMGDVTWSPHRLFGAPRYLTRQLIERWIERTAARLRRDPYRRLVTEFRYRAVLGTLAECRESGRPFEPGSLRHAADAADAIQGTPG
jgi:glycosyltransferase involved in cell wall biosynthesis